MRKPSALLARGTLAVWDIATGEELAIEARSLDSEPSWFTDGDKIVYADLVDAQLGLQLLRGHAQASDSFGESFKNWNKIPAIHLLDLITDKVEVLHVGMRAIVFPDQERILIQDLDRSFRIFDLKSKQSKPLDLPGCTHGGAIAFLEHDILLYWSLPTEGAEPKLTRNNSPLVGPKQMLSLKLLDLETGAFRTAIEHIDPRRRVSFGKEH